MTIDTTKYTGWRWWLAVIHKWRLYFVVWAVIVAACVIVLVVR